MRDIRPNTPLSNKRNDDVSPDDDAEMELYEASTETKAKALRKRPVPLTDRRKRQRTSQTVPATPKKKPPVRPLKEAAEELASEREVADEMVQTVPQSPPKPPRRSVEPKGQKTKQAKRWFGSKVPVTAIHVPEELGVHSDSDHAHVEEQPQEAPPPKPKKPLGTMRIKSGGKGQAVTRARVGHGERLVLLIFLGLVLLAGVVAAVIFLPTASVMLQLRTAPLLVDEEVVVAADGDGVAVPGTAFFREAQINDSLPVENTELVGAKAEGVVAIVNTTVDEQKIKERSRLVTADGQLFYMKRHAIVPPNSRVSIEVEAAEAGAESNIGAQRLDFAALDEASQQLVYAEATEGLSGGSGEEIAVVSEDEVARARAAAAESAKTKAEVEIRGELPEGWALLDESWTADFDEFETEPGVGEQAPELEYRGRVSIQVMGFEQQALEDYLRGRLEGQLDEEFMLFPGPISYTKSVKKVDWEAARAEVATRVTHTTIPELSLDTLREKLAGRSMTEAQSYLEGLPGVESVAIDVWPFWVRSIPRIEKRLSLELESERP